LSNAATFFIRTNLRAAISVSIILLIAILFTGFLSSAYKRERQARAQQHFNHGQALTRSGDLNGAVDEYRKALVFSPDDKNYRLALATALLSLGRLDEAQSHLEELLEDEPTDGLINLMLARVAEKRKRSKDVVEFYQRAVYGYWPQDKMAARHRARWELVGLLEKEGRSTELIGELLQLYANAGDDPNEKARIGFLLLKYGATSDAVNVFRELARNSPKYVEAHHGLGQSYLQSGDFLAARREFQRAMHLDPNDRENVQSLAFANAAINIDPFMPRLSSSDRYRRSCALLNRVLSHLEACSEGKVLPDPLKQRVEAAQKLLSGKPQPEIDDANLQLQDMAQALWNDQDQFCGGRSIEDKPLDAVLTRIGHE
jgi:Flp pilus assembly protein TadD